MKPAPFKYYCPTSIEEALELYRQFEDDARLLAGGQSLVPMMNFRLVTPSIIIDLNKINELQYIVLDAEFLRIGAMTRQRDIEMSGLIGGHCPLLQSAARLVGHLPTRSRGWMPAGLRSPVQ